MEGTLTDFLNLLDLRGQTWCFVDIKSSADTRGFSMPRNDDVLFYAVVEGSIEIDGVAGETIELSSGDVVMLLSGEAHRVYADKRGPTAPMAFLCSEQSVDEPPLISCGDGAAVSARLLCARLNVTWPKGLRRVSMPPVLLLGEKQVGFSRFSSVRVETLQIAASGAGAVALLTQLASVMLTASLRSHPRCQLLFHSSSWNDPISHAVYLIEENPAADWSIEQLAQAVGMGRSSFAARFNEQVGQTPMHFITELRMVKAAELLQQSDLKLIEISDRVGYSSEAAFSRRFTRHFGIPPSAMRHKSRPQADAVEGPGRVAEGDIVPIETFIGDSHH